MEAGSAAQFTVFPNSNYAITQKEPVHDKLKSADQRMMQLKEEYQIKGMRRSMDAVMLVEVHGHPHVILFQPGPTFYQLPGGELKPNESIQAGTNRVLSEYMLADGQHGIFPIAGLLSQWWRPNYDANQYPYNPPHVSDPKEVRRIVLIQLPKQFTFCLPSNYTIKAVPIFELHDNKETYGPVISTLPTSLSRFEMQFPGTQQ